MLDWNVLQWTVQFRMADIFYFSVLFKNIEIAKNISIEIEMYV